MIIVTGASRGLGRAICDRLHSSGQEVIGLSRSPEDAPFRSIACDVTDYDQVRKIAANLRSNKSGVQALINAAGVASMNLALTTPQSVTKKILSANLMGTIYCCQLFAPLMVRKGVGRIVNFSTIAVALGVKGESIYVASKAGIEGFSRTFAREIADFGITVNCVAPGPIDTSMLKGVSQEQIQALTGQQIFRKQLMPDDVCDVVEILLDKRSRYISGEVIHVGGV